MKRYQHTDSKHELAAFGFSSKTVFADSFAIESEDWQHLVPINHE